MNNISGMCGGLTLGAPAAAFTKIHIQGVLSIN